jgi:hypothetical protein
VAIDPISSNTSGGAQTSLLRPVRWGGGEAGPVSGKNFGEPIPKIADISRDPLMISLFSRLGMIPRIQSKLNLLSRKKGKIVPAKGTVASALNGCEETNFEDVVFAGVEFLEKHHTEEETVAGVLGHEWGHLVRDYKKDLDADDHSWEEIFGIRKDEEAAADAYSGKMLFMMGYSPEGMIRFLSKMQKKECHKYHSPATRAAIIRAAYEAARRFKNQAANLSSALRPVFSNPFTQKLIAVA